MGIQASETTMDLDALLEEVLIDAYDEVEQMGSLRCAFEDLAWPAPALLAGVPVQVTGTDWCGELLAGLDARLEREGEAYSVALKDLVFPTGSEHARHVAAYRRWLGLDREQKARVGHVIGRDGSTRTFEL